MDTKDVRRGSTLKFRHAVVTVDSSWVIGEVGHASFYGPKSNFLYDCFLLDQFEPILLTETIMGGLDFISDHLPWFHRPISDHASLCVNIETGETLICTEENDVHLKINTKELHILQNIWRSRTGEDLKQREDEKIL